MSDSPPIPFEPSGAPRLKWAACAVLLVFLVIGGWEGFTFLKLRLALGHAREELSKRQFHRAEFWVGRAFSVDQENIQAIRLMAEINEVQDQPAGLSWRLRAAQLGPGNPEDLMALAKSAWRFGQSQIAFQALNALPPDFKNKSAEYHELMAGFALADHEAGLAEACFEKAAELGRDNPVNSVNLAAFRLTNSPNPEERQAAAHELETALGDARVSLFAARALLGDALHRGDSPKAEEFARKLRSSPARTFEDDLSCLQASMSGAAFHPVLEEIERRAESNPSWTAETEDWLNANWMPGETLRWFKQLPAPVQANTRVQISAAQSDVALGDWTGLDHFLATCQWGGGDYLRRALAIRCKRELGQPWREEWEQLTTEAAAHPPEALLLAQMVIGWNWHDETIQLLWGAAGKPETESQALQYLWDLYSRAKDTREMRKVAKEQLDIDPSSSAKKNNEAFLSSLLFGASERSERLAQEATTAHPNIAEWAATYAYTLHLAGKEAEAQRVMEKLSPEALERPGVALYYAIVLAANGDYPKARLWLGKLNPNGMLPEEQKLAADLAQELNVASR